jgi:hypothetical protein
MVPWKRLWPTPRQDVAEPNRNDSRRHPLHPRGQPRPDRYRYRGVRAPATHAPGSVNRSRARHRPRVLHCRASGASPCFAGGQRAPRIAERACLVEGTPSSLWCSRTPPVCGAKMPLRTQRPGSRSVERLRFVNGSRSDMTSHQLRARGWHQRAPFRGPLGVGLR